MTNNVESLSIKGRIRALTFGVAYGDAIGATVEKLSAAEIKERYGRVTSIEMEWHRMGQSSHARNGRIRGGGIITDDTLMTLCLMSIYDDVKRHIDAWDMASGMVREIAWVPRWVPELQREAMLIERLFYPEKWIFQRHQLSSCDPRQGGIGNMVNCGAAMYIAPIGAINAGDPQAAYDEAIAFASGHQQSFGLEAAGVLAAAVAAAFVPGTTLDSIIKAAVEVAKDGTKNAIIEIVEAAHQLKGAEYMVIVDEFHRIMGKYSPMGDDLVHAIHKAGRATEVYCPSRLNSIEELPITLGFAVINNGDFYKTIQDGINSGRDTDSIGVMAGAILGAMHGEKVIDQTILSTLNRVNKFDLIASADIFAKTAMAIQHNDYVRDNEKTKVRKILAAIAND